ncbi:Fur family transcriptional regulator [Xanthovirga aplysinae]|uniref:Fur family transcriptional regulator n=1 Tax=Xanthovirga aplysinae TaxID=2529853 RepID=UPI0012BD2F42|nr:transcriptional repressor [Xanthovirga aplysinae]MTI31586.1 transcriptional repressor [Xanthovirga aplysinae]
MDNKRRIGDLLHAHNLRKTPIRTEMLEMFMDHDFALSANNVITKMMGRYNRVTIYRALNSFEEHGILHRASEDGHGIKYAMCGPHCPDQLHLDKHAHFVCDECHHTYCLEEVKVPNVELSNEFSVRHANYNLSGICKKCKT